jgi:hypothetical protein
MAFSKGFAMMMKGMGIDPAIMQGEIKTLLADAMAEAIAEEPVFQDILARLQHIEDHIAAMPKSNFVPLSVAAMIDQPEVAAEGDEQPIPLDGDSGFEQHE